LASSLGNTQDQLATAGSTTISANALGIAVTTTAGATTDYAYSPQGRLLAEHAGGATYYYLLGRLGSVLGLTNSSGTLVDHYSYTPYGQQTATKNTVANLFGYDGGLQVPGTPLVHFGARYYNPGVELGDSEVHKSGISSSTRSLARYGYGSTAC
jgi:YD repeat-containing protein